MRPVSAIKLATLPTAVLTHGTLAHIASPIAFGNDSARELKHAGWQLERVLSDNGNEFRSLAFPTTLKHLGEPPRLSWRSDPLRRMGRWGDDRRIRVRSGSGP